MSLTVSEKAGKTGERRDRSQKTTAHLGMIHGLGKHGASRCDADDEQHQDQIYKEHANVDQLVPEESPVPDLEQGGECIGAGEADAPGRPEGGPQGNKEKHPAVSNRQTDHLLEISGLKTPCRIQLS